MVNFVLFVLVEVWLNLKVKLRLKCERCKVKVGRLKVKVKVGFDVFWSFLNSFPIASFAIVVCCIVRLFFPYFSFVSFLFCVWCLLSSSLWFLLFLRFVSFFLVLSLFVGRRVRRGGFLFCLFFLLSFLNLFVFPSPLVCRRVCETVRAVLRRIGFVECT